MESPRHTEQPVIITTADGTHFRCVVEWVDEPLRTGAGQCVAERWVCRTTEGLYVVGPPVAEISSPAELRDIIETWRGAPRINRGER